MIGLVGTNSDNSTNRQLLYFMKEHFKNHVDIEIVEIKEIPLFNKPEDKKLPSVVTEIAEKIELIITIRGIKYTIVLK